MVLSTEYAEAVNARCTFQPLWVSGKSQLNFLTAYSDISCLQTLTSHFF